MLHALRGAPPLFHALSWRQTTVWDIFWPRLECESDYGARQLLTARAKLETQDASGWNPIHHAVANGHPDLLRLFIKHTGAALLIQAFQTTAPTKEEQQRQARTSLQPPPPTPF